MSTARRTVRTARRIPAAVVLLVPMALCVGVRLGRLLVTSDSVAQQSVVQTWLHVGHARTYLPPDTWLLKLPDYVVVEALPLAPRTRLLIESLTLDGITVVLLAVGVALLARSTDALDPAPGTADSRWATVVPLAWVTTVSGGLGQYLAVMPNSRNIELGAALVGVAAASVVLRRPPPPPASDRPARLRRVAGSIASAAAGAVGAGLLWVDDPYVAYLVGAPLALACVLWYLVRARDRRLWAVAGVLVASLAAIPVLRAGLRMLGVVVVPDGTGVTLSPHEILAHLPILWPSLVAQLGLDERGPLAPVVHAVVLAVLALGVIASARVTHEGWRRRDLALTFVGAHWPIVVVGVLLNRTIYDFHAGRYLVLAVFDLAVCLALAAQVLAADRRRRRIVRAVVLFLAAATLVNVVGTVADPAARPAQAAAQDDTRRTVEGTGATKGFADFWAADLFTQASGGRLLMSDVVCAGDRLRLRNWLTDTARVRAAARRTVIVWDPSAAYARGCPLAAVERQVGRPDRLVPTASGAAVLVFDRDVSGLLDPAA